LKSRTPRLIALTSLVFLLSLLLLQSAYADDPAPATAEQTINTELFSVTAPTAPVPVVPAGALQKQLFDTINNIRVEHGLPAYQYSVKLEMAAQTHVADMQSHNLRSHRGSDGSMYYERLAAAGYVTAEPWGAANETIGWGNNLERQVNWWMNSPVHRSIILSNHYTEIGIGYVGNPDQRWGHWWTVNYALPQ
jgi:uncharacterized protein YkwD